MMGMPGILGSTRKLKPKQVARDERPSVGPESIDQVILDSEVKKGEIVHGTGETREDVGNA